VLGHIGGRGRADPPLVRPMSRPDGGGRKADQISYQGASSLATQTHLQSNN